MSIVTTVLLAHDRDEEQALIALRDWLESWGGIRPLSGPGAESEGWGGNKAPQGRLWGGAFNLFDEQAFLEAVAALPWERPDEVQVFMKREWDRRFQVWVVSDGALTQVVDGLADGESFDLTS
jgi:hypothetical protein